MKSSPRVFISHAAGDQEMAQKLAETLRAHSLDVWMYAEEIAPGENFAARIAEALERANAMVVLLTPRSVESAWVKHEIEYALSSRRFEHRLIPVVLSSEDAPWLDKAPWVLRKLQMVTTPSVAKAGRQIAEALREAG
jgi:hypothetical protein